MVTSNIKFRVWAPYQGGFFFEWGVEKFFSLWGVSREQLTFQMFTGVLDSKKKEIYEGDIVRVNGKKHIIEWRGSGFYCSGTEYALDTCFFVGGEPKVIGNILENPELCVK